MQNYTSFFNFFVSILFAIYSYTTHFIFNNELSIYILIFLLALKLITGIVIAIRKHRFNSSKLPRILLQMITYFIILGKSWFIVSLYPQFYFIPGLFYGAFLTIILLNVYRNITLLSINLLNYKKKMNKFNKLLGV